MKKTVTVLCVLSLALVSVFAATWKIQAVPYAVQYSFYNQETTPEMTTHGFGVNVEVLKPIKSTAFSAGVEADLRVFNYEEGERVKEISALGSFEVSTLIGKKDVSLYSAVLGGFSYITLPEMKVIAPTAGLKVGIDFLFDDSFGFGFSADGKAIFFKVGEIEFKQFDITPTAGITVIF